LLDTSDTVLLKYSIYQSFGFDITDISTKNITFEVINFIHQFIALVLVLVFTSAIVLKYFIKPSFFYFKEKINIHNNILTISFYNKTDFQLINCHIDVYARLPYLDEEGMNSLNNVKLHPKRDKYPFMDKHLVTRIQIDLNDLKNNSTEIEHNSNESILRLLDTEKEFLTQSVQYLGIYLFVSAVSDKIDNNINEIQHYQININSLESIREHVSFSPPKSIDIDMIDFTKSKGWDNFED